MDNKKPLKIDIDELCNVMEDHSFDNEYYLDLETGEILFVSEYMNDEVIDIKNRIEEEYERFEQIPQVESYEGYRDMEDFIATVDNNRLVDLLEVAIQGKGAFRRFKDVLLNYPDEEEKWFQFQDSRIEERALEWLDEIGVTLIEE